MRIYLCRHGETDHNKKGILQGQIDAELNERGIKQARKLAGRFEGKEFSKIYSSDLSRAARTAGEISKVLGVEHEKDKRLRERTYGAFEGLEHERRYEEIEEADDLDDWNPEDGETVHDVRERSMAFIEELVNTHEGEEIVVIAHGWVNRAIITGILEAPDARAHSIWQDNTCVNVLRLDEYRGWRLRKLNDTSHL